MALYTTLAAVAVSLVVLASPMHELFGRQVHGLAASRALLWPLAWLCLFSLPAAGLLTIATVLAERLLYLPSVGGCVPPSSASHCCQTTLLVLLTMSFSEEAACEERTNGCGNGCTSVGRCALIAIGVRRLRNRFRAARALEVYYTLLWALFSAAAACTMLR